MHPSKRLAFFLPNIFTGLNMACGFSSMVLTTRGLHFEAAMILILGAIFDSVDGRVARLTGTSSSFGEQFDSMSDAVSFVVAPAFLMYQKYLYQYGRLGAVVSFIYLLCAALRLARFNANISKVRSDFFQGLPSPGAALAIIGLVLLSDRFPVVDEYSYIWMFYTAFYGILMVTTIPFHSFKDGQLIRNHKRMLLFIFFLIAALTVVYYRIMFAVGMALYVVLSLVFYFYKMKEFGDAFQWSEESES
ncbi:MAG: CDP-diacylglycerol--serine O-phosphatidyltransferase [Halobacteriovoraceae bacterium]|nr:CDP-diacylglycerol--serine O-phosphatidyltransferase [Halobacteriovoraceae bacterium]